MLEKSVLYKTLIIFTVMLVAIIEVLDMTIVSVCLPEMMGSLQASSDQITWVMTSYVVSAAVMMPLTGFLIKRFGQKQLLIVSISGFFVSSMLCGLSGSLTMMVIFRTLQGIFGAPLVPLSQVILRDTFPKSQQGLAMAIWGIGIMTAPVLGPTIGGYIAHELNWRWIFYINIPICGIALLLSFTFIKETIRKAIKIDWLGLGLLCFGIATLQIFLDRGNQDGWFHSDFILFLSFTSFVFLTTFVIRGIIIKDRNILHLRLCRDRSFAISSITLCFFSLAMFGTMTLQPIMFETLYSYSTLTTGLLMMPRGLASALGMIIVAPLVKKIDARYFIALGLFCAGIANIEFAHINLDASVENFLLPMIIQGFGMGFLMVPTSILVFQTLSQKDIPEASGLFSFGRNLGTSIGISLLSTVVTNQSQKMWNTLGGNISIFNNALQQWFATKHLTANDPLAIKLLSNMLHKQSNLIGFLDAFYASGILLLLMIPVIFFVPKPSKDFI